jgi:hypothetical protein
MNAATPERKSATEESPLSAHVEKGGNANLARYGHGAAFRA